MEFRREGIIKQIMEKRKNRDQLADKIYKLRDQRDNLERQVNEDKKKKKQKQSRFL